MTHRKLADFKFQRDDGTDLSLDDYVVGRMRHRKYDEDSRRELVAKCYVFRRPIKGALDDACSLPLSKITRTFTSLRVYTPEDFLLCSDGNGKSVTIRLRLQDGRFADVKLMLTDSVHEGALAITPGRYVKVEGPNDDYKELINMDIEVTGRDAGKQTANITFYHKEKGGFTVKNMALEYYIPYEVHAANHVNDEHAYVKVFKDCYATKRNSEVWPLLTTTFFHVNAAFDQSFKTLSEYSTMICVESKDTISFMYRTGTKEERKITLVHELVDLNLLARTAGLEDYLQT
ncbi:hypothetical protein FOZ63_009500 [Perkinsus olseni]|uniref:Uncharacterized protein n=1 Tax=Perkinsus olseni TaxID=32597 RepID=A0A7J6Q5P7_PEROL|nr:hypothetical protein FOZ63_009500 [Perkinsus olseni]KAF4710580.1 hypothetical protein FOZ62_018814 [Perkinsus olseni]